MFIVPNKKNQNSANEVDKNQETPVQFANNKVKFEIYGEEMIEKSVKQSGNSGRVYLPPNWVGHKVKIIRL
jgi:putative transposon-encoded protein